MVDIPEDPSEMSPEQVQEEHDRMRRHEDAGVLTREQKRYLNDLQEELLKLMSTSGEHADYEGA